jgi:hypothetical protein
LELLADVLDMPIGRERIIIYSGPKVLEEIIETSLAHFFLCEYGVI